MTLALKLLLAPSFVVAVSLAVRRYGSVVGGLLGGLPVVAGPILLVVTLEHGRGFGADAATGTIVGLMGLGVFVLVYAQACGSWSWPASTLAGWAGFIAVAAALSLVDPGPLVALAATWTAFTVLRRLMPAAPRADRASAVPMSFDLPVRALAAAAMVVALTAASEWLGPEWSGLLTPFPIITTVLAVFTHARDGTAQARVLLGGLLNGLYAFALFAAVLALVLPDLGTAPSFTVAVAAGIVLLTAIGVATVRFAGPREA